jgi:hypothetical protein
MRIRRRGREGKEDLQISSLFISIKGREGGEEEECRIATVVVVVVVVMEV